MFGYAHKLFSGMLKRLRGKKNARKASRTTAPSSRDGLFPLREAVRQKKNIFSVLNRATQTKTKSNVKDEKIEKRKIKEQISTISISLNAKSVVFSDDFMTRIQSASLTPDWFTNATRRSTTLAPDPSQTDFKGHLAEFAGNNEENVEDLFSEGTEEEDIFKREISDTPTFQSDIKSPNYGGAPMSPGPDGTPDLSHFLSENWRNLSTARSRDFSLVKRDPTWNELSLGRPRELSNWNNLSVGRARDVSNWKNLSLARSRGNSKSVSSLHREAALSCSMAVVSFQYALRRSTAVTPLSDDAFERTLDEFVKEQMRVQDAHWKELEKLTPNVECYTKQL